MNPDAQLTAAIGGVFVPILVGLLAKARAASGLKAVLNAALSALAAALAAASAAGEWDWTTFGLSWATTWAVSVSSYYGLWKPTGVAPAVSSATAGVGLGSSSSSP